MKRLDYYWYSQNVIAWLLLPLSFLYCAIARIRRFLYQNKFISSQKLDRPVIIIGNISVGGTGKTPLLIALCQLLKSKNIHPGVVSRGYKSKAEPDVIHQLSISDSADEVGDEPFLIMHKSKCPVVISSNRAAAGKYLIENNDCDVVLSDDGLQHYKLERDIEIAVVDSQRLSGNGFCIPSGPLREPETRLDSIDYVVTHHTGSSHVDSSYAGLNKDADTGFVLEFSDPVDINTNQQTTIDALKTKPVHAIAGIGHPQRFFNRLKEAGFDVIEHPFPDHHQFIKDDLDFNDDKAIIMTEKDAVKCKTLELSNAWAIPVTAILSDELKRNFMSDVEALLDA